METKIKRALTPVFLFVHKKRLLQESDFQASQKSCRDVEDAISISREAREHQSSQYKNILPTLTHKSFLDIFLVSEPGRRVFAHVRSSSKQDASSEFLDVVTGMCWPGNTIQRNCFFVQYIDDEMGGRRFLFVKHQQGRAAAVLAPLFLPGAYDTLIESLIPALDAGRCAELRSTIEWYCSVRLPTVRNKTTNDIARQKNRFLRLKPTNDAPDICVPRHALCKSSHIFAQMTRAWGFATLRRAIPPDILVDTLVPILLSCPLIVSGADLSVVACVTATLPAILWPLTYQDTHILVLPAPRYQILSSPGAFIIGITESLTEDFLSEYEIDTKNNTATLCLADGNTRLSVPRGLPKLPLRDTIISKLTDLPHQLGYKELSEHLEQILVLRRITHHSISQVSNDGEHVSALFVESFLNAVPSRPFAASVLRESCSFSAYSYEQLQNLDRASAVVSRSGSRDFSIRETFREF